MNILSLLKKDEIDINRSHIFIRHSIKENPPVNQPYLDVPLTTEGVRLAEFFGQELREFELKTIITSPLRRCIDTAKSIRRGYEKDIPIIPSTMLGNPGPYVEDEDKAGETFLEVFPNNIVKKQVENEKLPGFRDISMGSKMILDLLTECEPPSIFITHDVIIAAFLGYLNGKYPDIEEWIDYLDGFIFCPESKDTVISAEGFTFSKATIEDKIGNIIE